MLFFCYSFHIWWNSANLPVLILYFFFFVILVNSRNWMLLNVSKHVQKTCSDWSTTRQTLLFFASMLTNIRLHFRGFCCTGGYKKFQISQFMPTVYSSILGIVPILCNTSFIDDTVIVGDVGMHLMWIRNGFFFIHTFFVSNTLLICRLLNRKNSGLFFALCFSQWWDALEWWRRTCAGNDGEGVDWKKKRWKKGKKVKRWKGENWWPYTEGQGGVLFGEAVLSK